jgi:hypothetical protein
MAIKLILWSSIRLPDFWWSLSIPRIKIFSIIHVKLWSKHQSFGDTAGWMPEDFSTFIHHRCSKPSELKKDAVCFSEMLDIAYQTTRPRNWEHSNKTTWLSNSIEKPLLGELCSKHSPTYAEPNIHYGVQMSAPGLCPYGCKTWSQNVNEPHLLTMYEKNGLRRKQLFLPKFKLRHLVQW